MAAHQRWAYEHVRTLAARRRPTARADLERALGRAAWTRASSTTHSMGSMPTAGWRFTSTPNDCAGRDAASQTGCSRTVSTGASSRPASRAAPPARIRAARGTYGRSGCSVARITAAGFRSPDVPSTGRSSSCTTQMAHRHDRGRPRSDRIEIRDRAASAPGLRALHEPGTGAVSRLRGAVARPPYRRGRVSRRGEARVCRERTRRAARDVARRTLP
jgi:hypothetical protein